MPPAVGLGVAAAGALAGGIGAHKQAKSQKKYLGIGADKYSPQNIYGSAQTLNPWLMGALEGQQYGQGGYGQNLFNLAQNPGYIDPSMMNQSFHMSAQRANQDFNRAQGLLGKTTGGTSTSGLGNAYALANQASRTARDVNTQQQYTLFREQQRRSDLNMLNQMLQQTYGQAMGGAQGQAGMYGQMAGMPNPNAFSMGSNMLGAGMGAMAPFMGQSAGGQMGGQQQPGFGGGLNPVAGGNNMFGMQTPSWYQQGGNTGGM